MIDGFKKKKNSFVFVSNNIALYIGFLEASKTHSKVRSADPLCCISRTPLG